MITETILYIICSPILLMLNLLPAVNVTIPNGVFNSMDSLFSLLGCVFPMTSLCLIIGIKITLKLVKLTMALIVRIKSFIPTMGS